MSISIEDLSKRFLFHAQNAYHGATPENSSPLYECLALKIADEPVLLKLLVELDPHQQFANLLLGVVHYLLLEGAEHPLREFYPSLVKIPRPPQEAYPYFYAFCMAHLKQVQEIVASHIVQTNEVTRCASLLPAFALTAARIQGKSLAMIELGASAGLNLLWDAYRYDFGHGTVIGEPHSPVLIQCESRGPFAVPLPERMPVVSYRAGIDLAPINVFDPQATLWLRALIWPEHQEWVHLLESALSVARQSPPILIAGDLADKLPELLVRIPHDAYLCIFHSYTLNHCPAETRERLDAILISLAQSQGLCRISLEYHAPKEHPRLILYTYGRGGVSEEHLAFCESYGRWIEWQQIP